MPRLSGLVVEKLVTDRSGEKGDRDLPVVAGLLPHMSETWSPSISSQSPGDSNESGPNTINGSRSSGFSYESIGSTIAGSSPRKLSSIKSARPARGTHTDGSSGEGSSPTMCSRLSFTNSCTFTGIAKSTS